MVGVLVHHPRSGLVWFITGAGAGAGKCHCWLLVEGSARGGRAEGWWLVSWWPCVVSRFLLWFVFELFELLFESTQTQAPVNKGMCLCTAHGIRQPQPHVSERITDIQATSNYISSSASAGSASRLPSLTSVQKFSMDALVRGRSSLVMTNLWSGSVCVTWITAMGN